MSTQVQNSILSPELSLWTMDEDKGKCFICARGVVRGRGQRLFRGSPVFEVLFKLLGIKEEEGGIPLSEELTMCEKCSKVIQDLADLQELLEGTQKAIGDKVRWIKEQIQRARDVKEDGNNAAPSLLGSTVFCKDDEVEEELHVFKAEPEDLGFDDEDFAEPLDFSVESSDVFLPDKLNVGLVQSPKRRRKKRENTEVGESCQDQQLLKSWGLDKTPQLLVCLQRIQNAKSLKSQELETNQRLRRQRRPPITSFDVVTPEEETQVTNTIDEETDEIKKERNEGAEGDDPDFLPSEPSDDKRQRRRRQAKLKSRSRIFSKSLNVVIPQGVTKRKPVQKFLRSSDGHITKRLRRVNKAVGIVITDGKMWFGRRQIKEDEDHVFCCYDTCNFKFVKAETTPESANKLLEHMTVEHMGSGQYGCRRCDLRFKNSTEYQHHYSLSHKDCLVRDQQRRQLGKRFHDRVECDVCGKTIAFSSLDRHQWGHKSEEEKRQWISEGKPDPLEAERRTKQKKKKELRHQCTACGKRFPYQTLLRTHEELHKDKSEREKYMCDECGQIFVSDNGLRLHHRRAHNPDLNLGKWKFCPICPDVKYLIRTHLEQHMMRHHGTEKKHVCKTCGHRSATTTNLKRHMFVHLKDGERPFQCEFCPMNYKHRANMTRHASISHPDLYKPAVNIIKQPEKRVLFTCKQMYPCSICDRPFELPSRMRKHEVNCKK